MECQKCFEYPGETGEEPDCSVPQLETDEKRKREQMGMEKILIADDVKMNREMLADLFKEDYEPEMAENGMQALRLLKEHRQEYAAVLLNLAMPELDGFAVLEVMRNQKWFDLLPVIVISGDESREQEKRSLLLGASDFISKPFEAEVLRQRVKKLSELYGYKRSMEKKVAEQTKTLRKQYRLLQIQSEKLLASNEKVIDILGMVVEYRNLESSEHVHRVKSFTELLARECAKEYPEYGLTEEKIKEIASASVLHDLGMIAIPDEILLKPEKLTRDEFEYVKSHAARGGEILEQLKGIWEDEYRQICYEICRHHHERYDGKGYPDSLKGEEIPVSAQLVSIADVYDALVTENAYREAFSPDDAFHMIISGKCGVFSPKLLECFRNAHDSFRSVMQEHGGLS